MIQRAGFMKCDSGRIPGARVCARRESGRAVAVIVAFETGLALIGACAVLGACGGTTGREDLPQTETTADAETTIDGTLTGDSDEEDIDSGTFDVVIRYADRTLPDVIAPVEAGPDAEGGGSGFPDCPSWIALDDVGNITSDPTVASTFVPAVFTSDGGAGEAPDASTCATFPWYSSFAEPCFLDKVAGSTDFVPFPPCNWARSSGMAVTGPKAGASRYDNCMALYACIENSGCGRSGNPVSCLCGSDTVSGDCTMDPAGPCSTDIQNAFETPDLTVPNVTYILKNFYASDLTQPYGAPGDLLELYQTAQSFRCFVDAGRE
jgi:hypothetical protein